MWKKNDEPSQTSYRPESRPAAEPPPRTGEPRSGSRAVIGSSIRITGDLSGEEDLVVEGRIDGKVELRQHTVTVGKSGRVKADIYARTIYVEGEVRGNLFSDEQVTVRQSGNVQGNITAPRVSLEDGAKFKGAIDMEPKRAGGRPEEPRKAEPARGGGDQGKPDKSGSGGAAGAAKPSPAGATGAG